MIKTYFSQLETILNEFPAVRSYTLKQKVYNIKQGFISGSIIFDNGYRLDFMEVKDIDILPKIKYRYQYMDADLTLIFRYDNAQHHRHIETFPHHKHGPGEPQACSEPTLFDVLLEIAQYERAHAVDTDSA
jgi:hypothetical protein